MRETIEKLLNSDITGYRIAMNTGVGESLVSNIRNGKRDLDNISLKNAERLYEYQTGIDFLESVQVHQIEDDDILDVGDEMYCGFYEIMNNSAGNGAMISFVTIRRVDTEKEGFMFELLDAWADEMDISKDIDTLEGDVLANEMEENRYYFNTYSDALKYASFKYRAKGLKVLIEEYEK